MNIISAIIILTIGIFTWKVFEKNIIESVAVAILTLLLWGIIWLSIFIYYKSKEPVVLFNELLLKLESSEKRYSTENLIIAKKAQLFSCGNYEFEQISLTNISKQEMLLCYVIVDSLIDITLNGQKEVEISSRNIIWADSARKSGENKVDLPIGIPENIYFLRTSKEDKKDIALMGYGGINTILQTNRNYLLKLRILGINLSPHLFSVNFSIGRNGAVNIINISNPSLLEFFNGEMTINPISIRSKGFKEKNK
jgi:hypothetical protein